MYHYSVVQWVLFFYFYCFVGWCFESTYVSLKSRKFINRGFMKGPFLPLYGSGAMMMLIVSMPFQDNLILVYLAGCVGATALEYVTGVCMEALFKVRYWDYSYKRFHFQGHICLSSTLAWGVLTILMTRFIHKPVERLILGIPIGWAEFICFVMTILLVADYTIAFKAAMDLRDILIRLEKAQQEMELLKKRLDVLIAIADDERRQRREEYEKRQEDLLADIEARFNMLRENMAERQAEYREEAFEEFNELRMKFRLHKEKKSQLSATMGAYKLALIRNNPGMSSKHFKDAFEELKKVANEKISNHRK